MRKKNWYTYTAIFNYADDGISITFPDLPGCLSCSNTTEEAIKDAKEALGLHIWGMEKDGDEMPEPTSVKDIELSENDAAFIIEIFMPPVRERINNRFVKKTLSLPAWLAEKGDEAGVNFSKVFQNALMDYLDVPEQDKRL